eukprot:CAMPEP_0113465512 /NCGR_PEP_ID=MMETSP0014_2-20120614/13778_1 /TAXON_ID=2857 /ORGANISM="Nitzschia sp." /LENGTH=524 /DNA_ID=CAMNT_0000357673 /DNA_START=426 /DNA_END=2000 /DNA_ORIENTATION=+ /assembly_acc=CAM_ASM_000159
MVLAMMSILFLLTLVLSADTTGNGNGVVDAAGTITAAAAAATTTSTAGKQQLSTNPVVERRQLSNNDLSAIWTIPPPLWSYSQTTNVFQLTWDINDIIEDSQLEFEFYDSDCQVGGGSTIPTTGTGYQITTTFPTTQVGDGSSTRQFKMDLTTQIPQITLNNNPKLYFTDTDKFKMCVRLGLKTPSSQFSQEVNWSETLVELNYDLLNQGFAIDEAVDVYPPEYTLDKVDVGINLKAYDCTQYGDNVLTQGTVVKVCIEPVSAAIADGFRMRHVTYFKFVRPETNFTQWAVQDTVGVEPFSSLTCQQGSTQCVIEVFLLAGFYTSPGTIDASGSATMQLGEATSRRTLEEMRSRRTWSEHQGGGSGDERPSSASALRGPSTPTRSLQEDDDAAEEGLQSAIEQEILIKLPVRGRDDSLAGGGLTYGPDGEVEINPDDFEDFIMDAPLIKKWEYLLNNDAAVTEAESYIINSAAGTSGATSGEKESATPSYIASIAILVLIGLNLLALIMLAFQSRRCQNTKLYL